jgi:putative transposase
MRTIRRHSRQLNRQKWEMLLGIAEAYGKEKDRWLCELSSVGNIDRLSSDRIQRDILVQSGYRSPFGLQARQWKIALKDAVETLDRHWQAIFQKILPLIYTNSNLTDEQRHYCFWVLKSYTRLKQLILRDYPVPDFEITEKEIRKAGNYLNRIIRRHKGNSPRVGIYRSFCLDQEMYQVFEHNGTQYISIMTLNRGKRLVIPLSGRTVINGNIRVVLDSTRQAVEIHYTANLKRRHSGKKDNSKEALDFGYTEAFTDTAGNTYGEGLGQILSKYSDKLDRTGRARNKLHALRKKYQENGKTHKARHIRKFNLGYKKKDKVRHKAQASVENIVNHGLNTLYKTRNPVILITENLRHLFTFDNAKSINRKLSIWMKGIIQDRVEYKALERGSLHKQVNPAYGSQTCPECGFLWSLNRNGDRFKCLHCGYGASSDRVAAINYLHRFSDPEITLYVPYRRVREILMERFLRRLESNGTVCLPSGLAPETVAYIMKQWGLLMNRSAYDGSERTVPGRTVDTGQPHGQSVVGDLAGRQAGGFVPANTAPVNHRAKLPSPKGKTYLSMFEYVFGNR